MAIARGLVLLAIVASVSFADTYEHDAQGRLKKVIYDSGATVTYSYDANGNRTTAVTTAATDTTNPTAPSGLVAQAASLTQINLTWSAATDNRKISGYSVERCEGAGCSDFAPIGNSLLNSYQDRGLAAHVTYTYRVRSYDVAGLNSPYSGTATATTHDVDAMPPSVPVGLAGSASSHNKIVLSWTESTDFGGSGVAGYKIFRNDTHIGTKVTNSFEDTSVSAESTYTYRVSAFDAATPPNESERSASVSVTTPAAPDTTPPTVPTNLRVTAATSNNVTLAWNASQDSGGAGLGGYRVYRGGSNPIGTSTTTTFNDTNVAGSTNYTYTVTAYDKAIPANESGHSSPLSVRTPDTIKPTTPSSLSATAVSPNRINLSWGASTDSGGSGLAGYRIIRNGTLLPSVVPASTRTFSDTNLAGNTKYTYQVYAYDNANNSSTPTAGVSATTPPEIPAPPTGISGPIENYSGSYTITWNTSSGATRYELWESRLGSPFVKQHDGADAYKFFSGKTTGEYTYKAKACNVSGCSAYSSTHFVRVCRPQCL